LASGEQNDTEVAANEEEWSSSNLAGKIFFS